MPSTANAAWYAANVREAYARRCLEAMATPELLARGADLAAGVETEMRRLHELLRGTDAAPALRPAADFADAPQPAPVLWRDPEPSERDTMWRTGDTAILLVTFRAVPTPPYPADQQVLLEIAHPPNTNGAMVDRYLMRTVANASYRQFRAYVSTCCLVDCYGTQRGQLIDPASREGESYYAWLEGDDIILLTHHHVADTKSRQRGQRQKSLDTFKALRGLGVIDYRVRIGARNEIEALQPLPSPMHMAAYAHLSSGSYPQGNALLST